jgi:hypothetical protein
MLSGTPERVKDRRRPGLAFAPPFRTDGGSK